MRTLRQQNKTKTTGQMVKDDNDEWNDDDAKATIIFKGWQGGRVGKVMFLSLRRRTRAME